MTAVSSISLNNLEFHGASQKNNFCRAEDLNRNSPAKFTDEEKQEQSRYGRDSDDLYNALRPFLIFGKFIGVVPIQGLFQRDVEKLKFNKSSFPAFVSLTMVGILSVNVVMGFVGISVGAHTNAGEYAWAPGYLLFYFIGLFTFVYFYRHARDYIEIFRKWMQMDLTFTMPDTTLVRDLNLMAFFVMTSAVFENLLSTMNYFPVAPVAKDRFSFIHVNEPQNASALQIYYIRSSKNWAAIVPFHPLVAMFVLVSNKIATYAWNYSDLAIAFMSRALYHKFKALYKQSERLLVVRRSSYDAAKWKQLTYDVEILHSMASEIATLLSPVVFCSFGINVYFICLHLHLSLTPAPSQTLTHSTYAVWSVLHLVTRVFVLSLYATRINDWAHRLSDIFRNCPSEAYTTKVERAERFVNLNTIGLNGLGCFVVTKPLMLRLAGVVLTFEIVLLQFSQATFTKPICQFNNATL